jgi:hypothetical protein
VYFSIKTQHKFIFLCKTIVILPLSEDYQQYCVNDLSNLAEEIVFSKEENLLTLKFFHDMNHPLAQERDFALPNREIVSPWRNPLPLEDHTKSPVVTYFYSENWIPMTCFSLTEAIALYRKALFLGKEILVYPADVDFYTPSLSENSLEVPPVNHQLLMAS